MIEEGIEDWGSVEESHSKPKYDNEYRYNEKPSLPEGEVEH
jgi:hypothetical protein